MLKGDQYIMSKTVPAERTALSSRLRAGAGFAIRLLVGLSFMLVLPQVLNENLASVTGKLAAAAISVSVSLLAFAVFVRLTEGAWSKALHLRGAALEWFGGVALGALLSCISVGILSALGAYHVRSVADPGTWSVVLLTALPVPLLSGFVEELAIRGVITRQIARSFSPVAALVISACLFGAIHLLNENSTPIVGVGLVVQAGLLLGAAYLLTERLWFAIGLHFAWNYMQAAVFGGALSGHAVAAIITAEPAGPVWLSGGAFGIEGSIITTLVCALAAVALILIRTRRGLSWFKPQVDL